MKDPACGRTDRHVYMTGCADIGRAGRMSRKHDSADCEEDGGCESSEAAEQPVFIAEKTERPGMRPHGTAGLKKKEGL